jgi:beta-phosphoglucomutase-like phosphatase (HAD superfamily)
MREIKGIVFDCDGTLADTMPLHWKAWQAVTSKHGLHFPEDRFYALGGVPSRDIFRMLSRIASDDPEEDEWIQWVAGLFDAARKPVAVAVVVGTAPTEQRPSPRRRSG